MNTPQVGIIMGSNSDYPVMQLAEKLLDQFAISYETHVVSAHRTPDLMFEYAENARQRGLKVIIAGAGGAAHLPGMVAAKTTLPVLGVLSLVNIYKVKIPYYPLYKCPKVSP